MDAGAIRGRGGKYNGPDRRCAFTVQSQGIAERRRVEEKQRVYAGPYAARLKKRGVLADIRRRRRPMEALRGESLFRNLVETTGDVIWEADEHLAFTYVSPQVERLLGFSPDECFGKTPFDLMPAAEAKRVGEVLRPTIERKAAFSLLEHAACSNTGDLLTLECSAVPIINSEGRFRGYRGISRDISSRKKLEEATLTGKKLESVGILAGGIAHDFNNLLQVISGNISLAKELAAENDQAVDLLADAEQATRQASDLTKRLIAFSKGGTPAKKKIMIADLIRDTTLFSLSGSPVKCEFEIAENLRPVEADAGQLEQVISNIVLNATEAMPNGGTLRVCAENIAAGAEIDPSLSSGGHIRISFRDTGIGISKENLPRLFDPYFTGKKMGVQKGMGLGLAVCHFIIRNHNGLIRVASALGEGSTFSVYLPALAAQGREQAAAAAALRPGGGRILLMDDTESVRRIGGALLERIGYEVEFAENGEEAIRWYREASRLGRPFDAVILDLTVPGGMGAREAIKHLLEIDPGVKAVVSSGYREDPVMIEFARYGFKGAIGKPYTIKKLAETILAAKNVAA